MSVSVVIPTLDEAPRIAGLVRALLEDGFDEVIVADAASADGTAALAAAAGARTVAAARGRGGQLAAGAADARGDVLFFLHADTAPPPGARAMILNALAQPGVAAGCFPLAFDAAHPVLGFYAFMSRINHGLFTYGDQGLFLKRCTYAAVGGFASLPLFEDVDMVRRLRRQGRFVKQRAPVRTSARRFLRDGLVRRELANIALVALFHCGAPADRLARWYRAERAFRE